MERNASHDRGRFVDAAIAGAKQPEKEFVILAGPERAAQLAEVVPQPADAMQHIGPHGHVGADGDDVPSVAGRTKRQPLFAVFGYREHAVERLLKPRRRLGFPALKNPSRDEVGAGVGERLGQLPQPVRRRQHVVVCEGDDVARHVFNERVDRVRLAGCRNVARVHARRARPVRGRLDDRAGVVGRAVVRDQNFETVARPPLGRQRGECFVQQGLAILGRDDDRNKWLLHRYGFGTIVVSLVTPPGAALRYVVGLSTI